MCIAPGKRDLNGYTGAHARDLTQDLDALFTQFDATLFVSLMEAWEYTKFGIPSLFADVRARGAVVLHYPIVDVSIPTSAASFRVLIEDLRLRLESGERILVHCKGGLGRTGLVVACLLRRLGHTSEAAIRITRAARNGTIQTSSQEQWVRNFVV